MNASNLQVLRDQAVWYGSFICTVSLIGKEDQHGKFSITAGKFNSVELFLFRVFEYLFNFHELFPIVDFSAVKQSCSFFLSWSTFRWKTSATGTKSEVKLNFRSFVDTADLFRRRS